MALEVARIAERRGRDLLDDELTDLHSRKERDRVFGEVDHLQRDGSFEARMNRRRGEMHEQPDTRERAAPLDTRGVAGAFLADRQMNAFEGLAEDEFVGWEG